MNLSYKRKEKILIVDDSEMNRSILADMLSDEYDIVEAENGIEATTILERQLAEISLVLLDMVMPEMNGFEVLTMMNENRWSEEIPVIMISAESRSAYVQRAYELGVTDFIARPFDTSIVRRRVDNTILLYAKLKRLIELVFEQISEKERHSNLMIDILSHVVEFRNGESGLHILHVHTLTELLLKRLLTKTDRYNISQADISLITTASALHDIGKIAIDEKILNKLGKLSADEFEVMKTHSMIGAEMLQDLPIHRDEPLLKTAYEICRWHHERYDGRGYPDGLSGDAIPISAQVVALADVYDALTSRRVYKAAYTHETALKMIQEGQCGVFNPLLLECLNEIADELETHLNNRHPYTKNDKRWSLIQESLCRKELIVSERSLKLMDYERMKYKFFADMSEEIQFEYTIEPQTFVVSSRAAEKLGIEEVIVYPRKNENISKIIGLDMWESVSKALHGTSPEQPIVKCECVLHLNGQARWHRIIAHAIWTHDDPPVYKGAIGKAVDIHDSLLRMAELEKQAAYDMMTGLLNQTYAKKQIQERIEMHPESNFVLALFDLDRFKDANDTYGHVFGNNVLKCVAEKLRNVIRGNDIVARVGGDEFLLFLRCDTDIVPVIGRIFPALLGDFEGFPISVSMGIAQTSVVGVEYDSLFYAADQALYSAKRAGRSQYCFYDASMKNMFSAISPIDKANQIM